MIPTSCQLHGSSSCTSSRNFAILAILHLCLLRYFPSTNLVDRADNCYTSLYFYFSSFSVFIQSRISKLVVICSCCFFLFFPPIYLFHSTVFYSSFYSLFCFLPVYSPYFLISLMVFFSNLLSFLLSFPITLFCLLLPYALFLFSLFSFY